ncbi:glycosyltransferase family 2 protein [Neobacillus sp. OS1-33]|uniref:glycosyltransferase family 2 protein n=1 Tax=Neobacillus sp. OS1-33 TaxID=3070683 RepID=UPI0027E1B0F1|nr:glycosyltransferase family 2 protein [Neobacillus sp. OS1-33]WML25163.1 glycosyltransferase family 2 protein [Neobacillus sp. OS1-33]
MSKVSVIVPVYNAGKKLEKCIKSILNQSFSDFELIIVNDGSTDNSLEICKKHANKDKRIKLINKLNGGSIAARKDGVSASSNEYIMFVDADDWIATEAIEILYNETVRNHTDITVCNMYKVLGKGYLIKKEIQSSFFNENKLYLENEIRSKLVLSYLWGDDFPSSLSAKLYKKQLLLSSGKYLNNITFFGEDLFYNLEIFLKATRVKIINRPLYFYRQDGFTSKYMSSLYTDAINGYKIQKEVIDEYYQGKFRYPYGGISIMLLNTLKACFCNLFFSNLTDNEIKEIIKNYISNDCVRDSILNDRSQKFLSKDYLNAIEQFNIEYLFQLGKKMYRKRLPKKILSNIVTKLAIV